MHKAVYTFDFATLSSDGISFVEPVYAKANIYIFMQVKFKNETFSAAANNEAVTLFFKIRLGEMDAGLLKYTYSYKIQALNDTYFIICIEQPKYLYADCLNIMQVSLEKAD